MRFLLALRCFFSVLFRGRLPDDAQKLLTTAKSSAPELPTPSELDLSQTKPFVRVVPDSDRENRGAIQLLSLLQREGRLLDFLQEEIDGYADAQIGAAVRDIHRGCKKALAEHVPLEPILKDAENANVRVDVGFDPSRIRLVGNVRGEPPFSGVLRHHGWRTTKVTLPTVTGTDSTIVAPAEVEL